MENVVIIVSVIAELLITGWLFDGLVHWSDHLHNWEKKIAVKIAEKKNPADGTSDDVQPDIVNG